MTVRSLSQRHRFLDSRPAFRGAHPTLICTLLFALFVGSGCATIQSWYRSAGTYAVAAPMDADLGGRAEVRGHLLVTDRLSEVLMDTGKPFPPAIGLRTGVRVDGLGLEVATDSLGGFSLPHLDPGPYTIAFTAPGDREIWAEFEVEPNQRLDVIVWIQGDTRALGFESTPFNMMPGAAGYSAIRSGGEGGRRGKSGPGRG